VTAIGPEGVRIESLLFPVTEKRAYTFPLSELFDESVDSFIVEFFSAENLYIPFPAVMMNHVGEGFHNMVHSYNRILNDVFEDDETNSIQNREAAIDVRYDEKVETFIVFQAGAQAVNDKLDVEYRMPNQIAYRSEVPLTLPKLCHRSIRFSEMFPDIHSACGGVLTVSQPHQFLFFGRLLGGQVTSEGQISANHSYYDCSGISEYWENNLSSRRVYPYFFGYDNVLRFYPIQSPGILRLDVEFFGVQGDSLGGQSIGELKSPEGNLIESSIDFLAGMVDLDKEDLSSFCVTASPVSGNTPTRVNHQLVYGKGGLEASINVSLDTPNAFRSADKKSFVWGQVPISNRLCSTIGITGQMPGRFKANFEITYYGIEGVLARRDYILYDGSAMVIDVIKTIGNLLNEKSLEEPTYIWYVIQSQRPDLSAYVVTHDVDTYHVSGEHSF